CRHHRIHVYVAIQVVGLVKTSRCVLSDVAQVHKIYTLFHCFENRRNIIRGARAQRAGAKTDTIKWSIHLAKDVSEVVLRAGDPWQTQDRIGWIVGVYRHPDTRFLTHLGDSGEKPNQVLSQSL